MILKISLKIDLSLNKKNLIIQESINLLNKKMVNIHILNIDYFYGNILKRILINSMEI